MGALVTSCNICWIWSGMSRHVQDSPKRQSNNIIFVASSYTFMEATLLSSSFSGIWSGMPKVLWDKLPISLEAVEWFCYLLYVFVYVFRYPLKLHKYAELYWVDIVRHGLSANQIAWFFKLKTLENYMGYQLHFLHVVNLELGNISFF